MKTPIVMTIIAKDRPGLVEMISARIAECGGNWEESRMSRLGGHFAGILKVNVETDKHGVLVRSLESLAADGVQVIVNKDEVDSKSGETYPIKVSVIGQDHPGIIRDISMLLFKHDANVEELHTELQSEPISGNALFVASIKLTLSGIGHAEDLKADLEGVAADLMVDLDISGNE